MKKLVIFGMAAALAFTMGTAALAANEDTSGIFCGSYCTNYVDEDNDGVCDNCPGNSTQEGCGRKHGHHQSNTAKCISGGNHHASGQKHGNHHK